MFKGGGSRLKDVLFYLLLFVAVVSFAIAVTILLTPLLEINLSLNNIPEQVGLSKDRIMENYYVLLEYLHFPWVTELVMPDFPTSPGGAFHFYEVKQLFLLNYGLLFVSLPFAIYYLVKLKQTDQVYKLEKPALVAAILPLGLLAFLAINFDHLFLTFHEILFDNDAWLFNPQTDPIINVLTQDFFMLCFAFAIILVEVLFITGYLLARRDRLRQGV